MSDVAKGTVVWAGSKEVKTKRGKSKVYSFKLDTSEEFFRCGFDNPKLERGDAVSFNYETNEYGNQVDVETIDELEEGATPAPSTARKKATATPARENYEARAKYWEDKEARDIINQTRISYQAAMNTAVSIAELALANEAVKLPATANKRLDVLKETVFKLADELFVKYKNKPTEATDVHELEDDFEDVEYEELSDD